MMEITDYMCRKAVEEMEHDRIVGYSTPHDSPNGRNRTWGAPHYIRDEFLNVELWRGDNRNEFEERIGIEKMRLALKAALSTT